jgi:lipid-A-disaccharide synthase
MVNLIAGKTIVPELIQDDFSAENVSAKIRELVPDGAIRSRMIADLAEVQRKLHPSSSTETATDRAAGAILAVLKTPQAQLS